MSESVWTVEFITDVTSWGFASSSMAAYAYNGFCISDAYDVVVHADTTTAWSAESITLSYLATDCIASAYSAGGTNTTLISMTCTITMYNSEAAPRDHGTLNTAAAVEDYMNIEFASITAADGGATFNSAVVAAIDLDACPTIIATVDGIEAQDPDYFTSDRRRRLIDISSVDISINDLLAIVEENQEAAQVDEIVVTAATWMPSSSPTEGPSPLPTQPEPTPAPAPVPTGTPSMIPTFEETAAPSAKPITTPTVAPTYAVCTADSDCPVGTVCCVEEHTRRRHLAFGNTYGLCKPAC